MLHSLNVALSEALVLAEKAGVDRSTAYEVFASGAGGAPFVQYKRNAYEHPEDAPVDFPLEMVVKDLELITGLGKKVGAPMDQAETGLGIVRRAIAAGLGDKDLSAIASYLRDEGNNGQPHRQEATDLFHTAPAEFVRRSSGYTTSAWSTRKAVRSRWASGWLVSTRGEPWPPTSLLRRDRLRHRRFAGRRHARREPAAGPPATTG